MLGPLLEVVLLVSDLTSYVYGETLSVDGSVLMD
jgi:hypothetical protein